MALGAEVTLVGPEGERTLALNQFYQLDGMKKNVLQPGEFMLKVTLPKDSFDYTGSYQKLRVRESWDFPEAGVSAVWKKGDYSTLKIASTALESIPKNHTEQVSDFTTSWQNGSSLTELSDAIRKSVKPVNNTALPPNYRKSVVRILTKRALKNIGCE
jgi:CO/xanthine dehydrogenase FAD-binding subunit